ncbi:MULTISPECIES: phosphopantetheine-binding protein [unclassified Undibacterium]|uniref:phosphopantetheine-binding protein n=1 Tax=unclassified Undibacterium TaxID=2630295 RepID=UPI002AC8C8C4|nr:MULTISPECIES: phosphopantetheine-binding protein [unclassified Undibacterium]MEB0139365.1 phosphopantetheine-binding protein [Undibacterium sp. CCC2.1]MEB0173370.1 phosphopantetheine-binding protein [Undibacterium sp. CCC1.1]MEB0177243.1 phosphopantetheine-binding protein [Undibacterium sp. CCC3.4]MEB0216508.1 phosphopantetheine-binding protein [Undibacterium sp. 5I2]WPX44062.1 phosphopantetheine-binding protein [Undibacterium sp. CCC3.4]
MQEFFEGMAEILEIDVAQVNPALELASYAWDSLAVVSCMALVDDVYNVMLDGQALAKCEKLSDILLLVEAAGKS